MENTWIMVANSSAAYLYTVEEKKHKLGWQLIAEFAHPESRKKDTDLISDRLGRYRSSASSGHGAYSAETDPKEHEAEIFAKQLMDILESARITSQYKKLFIIAPPHFHGLLNKNSNKHINLISKHIEKDYTKLPQKKLTAQLTHQLLNSSKLGK